jgi:hypothetical protein
MANPTGELDVTSTEPVEDVDTEKGAVWKNETVEDPSGTLVTFSWFDGFNCSRLAKLPAVIPPKVVALKVPLLAVVTLPLAVKFAVKASPLTGVATAKAPVSGSVKFEAVFILLNCVKLKPKLLNVALVVASTPWLGRVNPPSSEFCGAVTSKKSHCTDVTRILAGRMRGADTPISVRF